MRTNPIDTESKLRDCIATLTRENAELTREVEQAKADRDDVIILTIVRCYDTVKVGNAPMNDLIRDADIDLRDPRVLSLLSENGLDVDAIQRHYFGEDLPKPTGWWNPTPLSTRHKRPFHYVGEDGRTLCRRWLYVGTGDIEEGKDDHPDNCMACRKKLAKLKQETPDAE